MNELCREVEESGDNAARPARSVPAFDPIGLFLVFALGLLVAWPSLALLLRALRDGGSDGLGSPLGPNPWSTMARPLGLALTSLEVVLVAEALALPLGIALALVLFRTNALGRTLGVAVLAVLVFVPLPLHATAWLGAFGNLGRSQWLGSSPLLRGIAGAGVVHALAALPWVVLLVGLGLRRVGRAQEEAALLERSAGRVILQVSLPAAAGSIAAAALLVAVQAGCDMTVTDLLQVRTYAEEAYLQAQLGGGPTAAATTALPPLLVLGGALVLVARTLARLDPLRGARGGPPARLWELGTARIATSIATCLVVLCLVGVPLGSLFWRAGRVAGLAAQEQAPTWSWYGLLGTLERAWPDLVQPAFAAGAGEIAGLALRLEQFAATPLGGTILWSLGAAVIATLTAWGLAWKTRASRGWSAVAVLTLILTLATPAPVLGMALKLGYLPLRFIHDNPTIVVLTLAARVLPYALLVLLPAHRAIPARLLEAAQVEGMTRAQCLRLVVWPQTARATAAAGAVAFALAVGELAASNLILPPGFTTLSFRVWSLLHTGVESHLAGVGLLLIAIHGLLGAAAVVCLRRSLR